MPVQTERSLQVQPQEMSTAQVLATMRNVHEKIKEGLPAWDQLIASQGAERFLAAAFALPMESLSLQENLLFLIFLIHVYQSLEMPLIRAHALKLVHLALWVNLSPRRLQLELRSNAEVAATFQKLRKALEKKGEEYMLLPRTFIPRLLRTFMGILNSVHPGSADPVAITYCERFVEFLNDLLSQLPTRRFFRAYLEDCHTYVECLLSQLYRMPEEGRMFRDLLGITRFYLGFEIDDFSGEALDNNQIKQIHTRKLIVFQRVCWKFFRDALRDLAMCNLGLLEVRKALRPYLERQPPALLRELCGRLALLGPAPHQSATKSEEQRLDFLLEVLLLHHEKRVSQLDAINALPLYPNESILWDFNMVPETHVGVDSPLALPKLNLQFLTFHDYLLRNFNLFRLESTYEIREDIEEAIIRLEPRTNLEGKLYFKGMWKSRMAVPIEEFIIKYVGPADIGQIKPHDVRAQITVDLSETKDVPRQEWNEIRQHDVLFLVTVEGPQDTLSSLGGHTGVWRYDRKKPFLEQYRVTHVRGCEVIDVRDEKDNVFTGLGDSGVRLVGTKRFIRVHLDTAQYHHDVLNHSECYQQFKVLIRRKPKENNFKAVLESIRDLMNTQCVVPEWLHDVFLGYGDPDSAYYKNMPDQLTTVNFVDSLVDLDHVRSSFEHEYHITEVDTPQKPPFLVTFPPSKGETDQPESRLPPIKVRSYLPPNEGPYPHDQPRMNTVRFTPVQVEALKASSNPGLTMVVGPPGTGKTDVAVQIISNIYHNFPNSRTLVVTHSNNALNDIFEKITLKDVDERHLLRLGAGHKDLRAEMASHKDFSKHGRVEFMLERRLIQLKEVRKIADALGIGDSLGDVDYTCETSAHFYRHEILARWEKFLQRKGSVPESELDNNMLKDHFPFHAVFADVLQLFNWAEPFAHNWYIAEGCWRHIQKIFEELEDCRAFELFKTSYDRGNYLLCRQAKIIAMTCTFAALKRHDMVRLKFEYDTIVMEEAAQILEIETFIPMLLQNPTPEGGCRLKRVVLIGDHNQLPPVVKNMAFQKYSHMDQSLFTRLVRLGVPTIQLNAQGRMRPSLGDLYRWKYDGLGDLSHVDTDPTFKIANCGFSYEYQCIDVPYYNGQGETEPQPHFFQNLGEAEYIVSTYMYMRLLGYPAEKITILTTYNGQKFLLRDVLSHRCGPDTVFGMPAHVTTVDKFQGRQNDYILLSLVRTNNVGHIRDRRRMVVAMSRARLGLYVFCKVSHFKDVWELKPFFDILLRNRPTVLSLNLDELKFPTQRPVTEVGEAFLVEQGVTQLGQMVDEMVHARVALESEKYTAQCQAWETFVTNEQKRQEEEARRQQELERQRHIAQRTKELKRRRTGQPTAQDQARHADAHKDSVGDEEEEETEDGEATGKGVPSAPESAGGIGAVEEAEEDPAEASAVKKAKTDR
eukprot:RCo027049